MTLRWIRFGLFGLSLGLAVLLILFYQIRYSPITYVQDKPGFGRPDIGGPFTLIDQFGKERHHDEFYGKIQMIYFGYSFCPDVCPLGLQNMSAALQKMGKDIHEIAPIFITIDPQRDTSENLKIYAENWHSSFVFLTGLPEKIQDTIKSFKVYAAKATPDNTMADYLMDHSTLIYFMDRKGNFIEAHPHTTSSDILTDVLKKILLKNPL